jgi:hypothetical protein
LFIVWYYSIPGCIASIGNANQFKIDQMDSAPPSYLPCDIVSYQFEIQYYNFTQVSTDMHYALWNIRAIIDFTHLSRVICNRPIAPGDIDTPPNMVMHGKKAAPSRGGFVV